MTGQVKLGTSSGGNVVIAPASAISSDVTISVPSVAGNFITTGTNDKSIPKAALPIGSILQVVQTASQPNAATTSSSWTDTGLSVSITPTSSSSKILVLVTHVMQIDGGNAYAGFQLLRNSSAVCDFMDSSLGFNFSSPAYQIFTGVNYIDSPATTSATTYKTQFRRTGGSGIIYLGLNSPVHSITAMEIAA